jgi:hypothetical protein
MSTHQNAPIEKGNILKYLKKQMANERAFLADSDDRNVLSIYYSQNQRSAEFVEEGGILDDQAGCATAPPRLRTMP